jgi:hypothetical protein
MKLTGENRSTRGKTCTSYTLSTTNPTWTDPGSNPGLRGGRPAANRLSHGTALPWSQLVSYSVGYLVISYPLDSAEGLYYNVNRSRRFIRALHALTLTRFDKAQGADASKSQTMIRLSFALFSYLHMHTV